MERKCAIPLAPSDSKSRLRRTASTRLPFSLRSAASRLARFSGTSEPVCPAPVSPASRGPMPKRIRGPPLGLSFA